MTRETAAEWRANIQGRIQTVTAAIGSIEDAISREVGARSVAPGTCEALQHSLIRAKLLMLRAASMLPTAAELTIPVRDVREASGEITVPNKAVGS